jgi:uncharacterized protein (TIGR00251 family)
VTFPKNWLTRDRTGARAALKVVPGAATTGVCGIEVDAAGRAQLVVRVSASPDAGRANAALIRLLAKRWRVPQGDLAVVSGARARRKVLQIRGSPDALIARVETIEETEKAEVGRR